jgi:glycosyltransferase involved in cell wall biosynthesis
VRVTHVAPTQFGADGLFGGGERYPLELARALSREVDCELISFGPERAAWRDAYGLRHRVLRPLTYLHGHPAHPLSLGLPAALAGASLVHTHHMRSAASRTAALTARLLGRRTAVTDHGLDGGDWRGLLPRLFDRFLAVSAYSARELGSPPARTRIIYGGADRERFFPGPEDDRSGVLFVGRLTPHKGVDRLIASLPPEAVLTIAGSEGHDRRPPESGYPSLLRGLAARKTVHFLGPVGEQELPVLYRSALVLVLPSVHRTCFGRDVRVSELLGLVLLEAMMSGTAVIASRLGGIPEVVEDGITGYLVTPGDERQLHDRIQKLLGDPGLARRMGRRARDLALERFTWQACAARCMVAYDEITRVRRQMSGSAALR